MLHPRRPPPAPGVNVWGLTSRCPLLCVSRGAAEPQGLRGVRVRRGGGAEEPGEPPAEQEQGAGAAEQWPQQ